MTPNAPRAKPIHAPRLRPLGGRPRRTGLSNRGCFDLRDVRGAVSGGMYPIPISHPVCRCQGPAVHLRSIRHSELLNCPNQSILLRTRDETTTVVLKVGLIPSCYYSHDSRRRGTSNGLHLGHWETTMLTVIIGPDDLVFSIMYRLLHFHEYFTMSIAVRPTGCMLMTHISRTPFLRVQAQLAGLGNYDVTFI